MSEKERDLRFFYFSEGAATRGDALTPSFSKLQIDLEEAQRTANELTSRFRDGFSPSNRKTNRPEPA